MMLCWRRRGRFDDYDDYDHLHHRRNKRHATVTGFLLFGAFLLCQCIAARLVYDCEEDPGGVAARAQLDFRYDLGERERVPAV